MEVRFAFGSHEIKATLLSPQSNCMQIKTAMKFIAIPFTVPNSNLHSIQYLQTQKHSSPILFITDQNSFPNIDCSGTNVACDTHTTCLKYLEFGISYYVIIMIAN